jgi:hypothetical protein
LLLSECIVRTRWIHNQFRYFQVDWVSIRVVTTTTHEAEGLFPGAPVLFLRRSVDDPDPITLLLGLPADLEQRDAIFASLRADLQWVELTCFASQNGETYESPYFVRVVDIAEMRDQEARTFHGPGDDFLLPEGLSITLTPGVLLPVWIRATNKSAERLRQIVQQDWRSPSFEISDPLT